MRARMGARGSACGHLVLAVVLLHVVNGHVLVQFPKSLMDKSGSAEVACTPSFWARLFYIKSTMDDSYHKLSLDFLGKNGLLIFLSTSLIQSLQLPYCETCGIGKFIESQIRRWIIMLSWFPFEPQGTSEHRKTADLHWIKLIVKVWV